MVSQSAKPSDQSLSDEMNPNVPIESRPDSETLLRQLSAELRERRKELQCHNRISIVLDNQTLQPDIVYQTIVDLIPAAFQFPDQTRVSLLIGDHEYTSRRWSIADPADECFESAMISHDAVIGRLKVCGHFDRNENNDSLFLPEEKELMYTITQRIIGYYEKIERERQISEKEIQYRHLLDSINEAIFETNHRFEIDFISSPIETISGFAPSELVGHSIEDLMEPEDRAPLKQAESTLQRGRSVSLGLRLHHHSNRIVWILLSANPIMDEGRLKGVSGFIKDITELKQMDMELRKFRTIADQANYGNAIASLDGKLLYVNEAFAVMHGWTVPQLIGRDFTCLHTEQQMSRVTETLEILKNKGGFVAEEVWRLRKDGSVFPSLMNAKIILDDHQQPQFIWKTVVDITHQKEIEAALRKSEERLNKAQEIAHMGSWEFDLRSRNVFWSENFYRLMGRDPSDPPWTLDEIKQHILPEDRDLFESKINEISLTQSIGIIYFRIILSGDRIRWIQADMEPCFENDRLIMIKGVSLDITEKMEAEAKIKLQNERLNAIISGIPDLIFVIDREGIIREYHINDIRKAALPADRIIGTSIRSLFDPETAETHIHNFETCLRLHQLISFEYSMAIEQHESFYEARIVPLDNDQVLAFVRDITEQKKAKYQIEESRNRARRQQQALAELLLDDAIVSARMPESLHRITEIASQTLEVRLAGIWEVSDDQTSLLCLSQFDAVTQIHTRGAVLTRKKISHYFEALLADRRIDADDARHDPRTGELTADYLDPLSITSLMDSGIIVDGKLVGVLCLEHTGTPRIWNADEKAFAGTLASIVGQTLAAVRRIQAESILKASEERYRRIVETTREGVWLLDKRNITTFVNTRMASMLGCSPAEMLGYSFYDFVSPEEMKDAQRSFPLHRRGIAEECELKLLCRDHQGLLVIINSTPILDDQGHFTGTLNMVTDISDRQRAEDERIARHAAEEANRAKSAFLSNMSHEIRTPLNAIIGYAQILEHDSGLSSKQIEQVRTIARSGDHLLKLINDVLDLSKIESGKTTLNPTHFNLNGLVEELKSMFGMVAADRGLMFTIERHESVPDKIIGDEEKLRQILINLLGNAFKFTKTGGVTLRFQAVPRSDGFKLKVEIQDTGPGISEHEQKLIFESFRQAEAGMKNGGTGLGLAISRSLIEMMGGTIRVESQPGQGSLFRFEIPLQISDQTVNRNPEPPFGNVIALHSESLPCRVLVVDDIQENRDLMRDILAPVGFEVFEAIDGREGITAFRECAPDIIFMDLRMPDIDGYQATRIIRASEDGTHVPIVALTASAFEEDKKAVLDAGFDGYVRKPFRSEELFQELGRLLNLRYIFDVKDFSATPPGPEPDLSRDDLVILPDDLAEALLRAVKIGDMGDFMDLLAKVEPLDSNVARRLEALAKKYRYDELIALLTRTPGPPSD